MVVADLVGCLMVVTDLVGCLMVVADLVGGLVVVADLVGCLMVVTNLVGGLVVVAVYRDNNVKTELEFHTSEIRWCYRYKLYCSVNIVTNFTYVTSL